MRFFAKSDSGTVYKTIITTLCVLSYVIAGTIIGMVVLTAPKTRTAAAATRQEMTLAANQKLVGMSWHCWAGGSCEPWFLTRARRANEPFPETYSYTNGQDQYVVHETKDAPDP